MFIFFCHIILWGDIITYTVKSGDTLYGISNQYGVSVTELARLNNVTAESLKVGQVLNIPVSSGSNPNTMFMYTVKSGDTLYKIATKYNTSVDEIKDLNNLTSNTISIGQVLRIPEMYTKEDDMILPNYINYIVKKGDTVYSIARLNNLDVDTIVRDNSLSNTNLKVGQSLKLRVMEVEECFGTDFTPPSDISYIIYTVKKGDSLYAIANKYNTSVNEIKSLNNLTSNNLSIGDSLKIPSNATNNNIIYIVKSGDNLYSIARKFNATVNSIKLKNNLSNNLLSIGQKLII